MLRLEELVHRFAALSFRNLNFESYFRDLRGRSTAKKTRILEDSGAGEIF